MKARTKPKTIISRDATNGRNLLDLHSKSEDFDFVKASKAFKALCRPRRFVFSGSTYVRPQREDEQAKEAAA